MDAHGRYFLDGRSWTLMGAYGRLWALMNAHGRLYAGWNAGWNAARNACRTLVGRWLNFLGRLRSRFKNIKTCNSLKNFNLVIAGPILTKFGEDMSKNKYLHFFLVNGGSPIFLNYFFLVIAGALKFFYSISGYFRQHPHQVW
jgi:hypothetical protein